MKTKLLGTLGVLGAFFMTTSMTAKTTNNTDSKPTNKEVTIEFAAGKDATSAATLTKSDITLTDPTANGAFKDKPYVFGVSEDGSALSVRSSYLITSISIYSEDDSALVFKASEGDFVFHKTTHLGTVDFSGTKEGGVNMCGFTNDKGTNVSVGNIYVTIKKDETPSFTVENSIGGYRVEDGNKVQFVSFGFQISSLDNVTEFGITIHKDNTFKQQPLISCASADITSLKAKDGRFYTTIDENIEGFEKNHTYYAVAHFICNGTNIQSKAVAATGNDKIEYKFEK